MFKFQFPNARITHKLGSRLLLPATLAVACAPASFAAQLEEVLVTAQKRVESLQDVPIAITAVSGETIQSGGITSLEDLAPALPNFQFAEAVSGSDNVFMRGI